MAQPPHRWQSTHPPIPDPEKIVKVPLDTLILPFRATLTPAQQAQLQQEFHAYWQQGSLPALVFNQMIDRLGELALPDLAPAPARQRVGYEVVHASTNSSIIGRVLLAPLRLMTPVRFFKYFPKLAAGFLNYGSVTIWEETPQRWSIEWTNQPLYMDYLQGNFQAVGAELLKVPGWRVAGTVQGPQHYLFAMTW